MTLTGELSLYFALGISFLLGLLPMIGFFKKSANLMRMAEPFAYLLFVLLLFSIISLGCAFYQNDFTYKYVFEHSNTTLPLYLKLTAIWAGHEGSMLLWVMILSGWMAVFAYFNQRIPLMVKSVTLAFTGWISLGFIAFVVLTSNPFTRIYSIILLDGRDLNPLLQDIGLIIHPPMLYMGYVGLAIPFAFICAMLLTKQFHSSILRSIRPWVLACWGFLTIGIVIGSWWAYYVLGWGGWWFWDPVENASLIPWLTTAALIHLLAASEKRGVMLIWTLLIAISCFSFSVLGTFLVRSGVLTSVHSFASDPKRGVFILVLLALTILVGLLLLFLRFPQIKSNRINTVVSREFSLLTSSILLVLGCLVVTLGTLFPLMVDVFNLGKISVGAPYFNTLIIPISFFMLFTLGFMPLWRFKHDRISRIGFFISMSLIVSIVLGLLINWLYANEINLLVSLTLILSIWVMNAIVIDCFGVLKNQPTFMKGIIKITASKWGMWISHLGIVVLAIGIAMTSHYSIEKDSLMALHQPLNIKEYTFTVTEFKNVHGPNYHGIQAIVHVMKQDQPFMTMYPEKRIFNASRMPNSQVAIRPSLIDDLYIAMGEQIEIDNWSMRIYVKPFVRWIWLGGLLIALGGFIAMFNKRYRS